MNFEHFYHFGTNGYRKVYGYTDGDIYHPMKQGWEGCKEEVLKIISEDIKENSSTLVKLGHLEPPAPRSQAAPAVAASHYAFPAGPVADNSDIPAQFSRH